MNPHSHKLTSLTREKFPNILARPSHRNRYAIPAPRKGEGKGSINLIQYTAYTRVVEGECSLYIVTARRGAVALQRAGGAPKLARFLIPFSILIPILLLTPPRPRRDAGPAFHSRRDLGLDGEGAAFANSFKSFVVTISSAVRLIYAVRPPGAPRAAAITYGEPPVIGALDLRYAFISMLLAPLAPRDAPPHSYISRGASPFTKTARRVEWFPLQLARRVAGYVRYGVKGGATYNCFAKTRHLAELHFQLVIRAGLHA
ncbi:hypothetical protein EVAR_29672_1 [Eumeta japonica]|uniref:Uncharacterized protein n=1 Tax=Eumeta variegata TaxID=151549 RepID=A0A4C1W961_EUMVA|nr:hypothetical protein EVAR_29672_1 [Eumeta japonica]